MIGKVKEKIFPEKTRLVNANKAALKDSAQKIADRTMAEIAEQGPEDAGLIEKYHLSFKVRDFTYVRTDKDGTERFSIPLSAEILFPVARATKAMEYELDYPGKDGAREDGGGFPETAFLRYLDDKLSESFFSGYVRDQAADILEQLSRGDGSIRKGFQINRKIGPGLDAALSSVTAPGNLEKYRKTAEDRFRELCRGSSCECMSNSAIRLQLEDVGISFLWKKKRKGKMTVQGDFRYSRTEGKSISARSRVTLCVFPLFDPLADEEDIALVLEQRILESAAGLAKKQYERAALVYSDRRDPGLPRSLRKCLSMGGGASQRVTGSVWFSWQGHQPSRAVPAYVIWGEKPVLACGEPPLLRPVREIDWQEALDADICPYSIDGYEPPRDLYEFAEFISQARELYDGMETIPGLTEKPAVAFEFDEDHPEVIVDNDNMDCWGETIRDTLQSLFREKMRQEYDRLHHEDRDPEIPDSAGLTGAELAILRYIYKKGGQSASSIARLETDPRMTQDALKAGLEKLSDTYVKLPDGSVVPLLQEETEWIRKYNLTYTAYYPQRDVPKGMISGLPRRAYTFSDIDSFIPSVRDEWRAKLMADAAAGGSESRWEALTCFESFPKTFQAKYIKTEEGQEFFAGFEGDDATYAELVLSGISGGKTLAKKLYAEKEKD